MFREMRREDKKKSPEETLKILTEAEEGVLALHGDDGYPYAVPVNHTYVDGTLYFHGAKAGGHKLDAIKNDPKACYTVIGSDVIDAEAITTIYKSVICFGKARIVESDEERDKALELIIKRFIPDYDHGMAYVEKFKDATAVFALDIEHMTGKGLAK